MTTITIDRAVVEQALEALKNAEDHLPKPYSTDASEAITALRAALAQQAEPVEPVSNEALRLAGLALIGLAEHDQHCDVFDLDDQGRHKACTCGLNDAIAVITQAGKSAPPQQAEPDHETRAELAEQQVVQLAEERDHYRNLWQKAQQAEPVQEPAPMPLFPPVSQWKRGCAVCGIGADGKAYGYVCPRSDCPTKITCGGVA